MTSTMYAMEEEMWSESVSGRSNSVSQSNRLFQAQRANQSGREKHARRSRFSRSPSSSHSKGGFCRRGSRRSAW